MARTIPELDQYFVRYPWRQWTDGRAWRVRQGADFRCSVTGFRSSLYMRALREKKQVKVSAHKKVVEFQFYDSKKPGHNKETRR
jgi:hypothetical protein